MKKVIIFTSFLFAILSFVAFVTYSTRLSFAQSQINPQTEDCIECHKELLPGIVKQWQESLHKSKGVGCNDCHDADRTEPDAIAHEGGIISTIVTPEDCGECHKKQMEEHAASRHATSVETFILNREMYKGVSETFNCHLCHGSVVQVREDGTPDPKTWPNSGIGRINPDGSKGACNACHIGHSFSKVSARQPEVCGRCHLGPNHPQLDIYEESKHGIQYISLKEEFNIKKSRWIPGIDYYAAPTCATCHISATRNQEVSHNVSGRLSHDLSAAVVTKREGYNESLENMKDVCRACHGNRLIDNYYEQYEAQLELYNRKFAIPTKEIIELLRTEGIMEKNGLDKKLTWIYSELLYHEGRKAQHGAAMGGNEYALRHGIYNASKNFYTEFLPEVEKMCIGAGRKDLYEKITKKYITNNIE